MKAVPVIHISPFPTQFPMCVSRSEAIELLKGSVWHTTTLQRYTSIEIDRRIKCKPDIPDSERWKTAYGPMHYPFVRMINGISLFDFRNFDQDVYDSKYPLSSWHTFVPSYPSPGTAVWIEIDFLKLGQAFIEGEELVERWKQSSAYAHTLMPIIECCCTVDIHEEIFKRVICLSSN